MALVTMMLFWLYLLLIEPSAFAFNVLPTQQHSRVFAMRQSSSAGLTKSGKGHPANRFFVVSDHLPMFMGTNSGSSSNTNDANPNIGRNGAANNTNAEFPKTTTVSFNNDAFLTVGLGAVVLGFFYFAVTLGTIQSSLGTIQASLATIQSSLETIQTSQVEMTSADTEIGTNISFIYYVSLAIALAVVVEAIYFAFTLGTMPSSLSEMKSIVTEMKSIVTETGKDVAGMKTDITWIKGILIGSVVSVAALVVTGFLRINRPP
jgi:hypothetical protein